MQRNDNTVDCVELSKTEEAMLFSNTAKPGGGQTEKFDPVPQRNPYDSTATVNNESYMQVPDGNSYDEQWMEYTTSSLSERMDASHAQKDAIDYSPTTPLHKSTRRILVYAGVLVLWFVKGLDNTILTIILPSILFKFKAMSLIGWITAGFLLPQATLGVAVGKFSDKIAIKRSTFPSMALLILGSVLCIAANSGGTFIFARVTLGIGTTVMSSIASSILANITTREERPLYFAAIVSMDVISLGTGSLVGGLFETKVNYRFAFVLTTAMKVVSAALILLPYKEVPRRSKSIFFYEQLRVFDFVGFGLLLTSSLLLLMGPQFAAQANTFNSPGVLISLILAVVNFILFILHQCMHPDPENRFLPVGIFNRHVTLLMAAGFGASFASYGLMPFLSIYFQTLKSLTSVSTALALLGSYVIQSVTSIGSALIINKLEVQVQTVVIFGSVVLLIGCFAVTVLDEHTSVGGAAALCLIPSLGTGIMQTQSVAFAPRWVPENLERLTTNLALMVQFYGATLGIILTTTLFQFELNSDMGTSPAAQEANTAMMKGAQWATKHVAKAMAGPMVSACAHAIQSVFFLTSAMTVVSLIAAVGLFCVRQGSKSHKV